MLLEKDKEEFNMSNSVKPYAVIDLPTIESVSSGIGMVGGIVRDGVSRTVIVGSYACNLYYTINTASDSNNDCIAYDITLFVDKELESTILFGRIPRANDLNLQISSAVGQLNYVNTIKCSVSIDVSSSITTEPKYISTIRESLLKIVKRSIAILPDKRMVFFNVPIDPTLDNTDGPLNELKFNTKLPSITKEDIIREAERRGITQDSESDIEDKFTIDDIKNCILVVANVLFYTYIISKIIILISQYANKILKILKGDENR